MSTKGRFPFWRIPKTEMTSSVNLDVKEIYASFYYIGVFLDISGSAITLGGLFSHRWNLLTVVHGQMSNDVVAERTIHLGPWEACKENGECGRPWDIVAGIGYTRVRCIQILVGIAVSFHLGSLVVTVLKFVTRRQLEKSRPVQHLHRTPVQEIISSIAGVSTVVVLLVMGQLKRAVILTHDQTQVIGPGFLLTLVGLLLIVMGILFMLMTRHYLNLSVKECTTDLHCYNKFYNTQTTETTMTDHDLSNESPISTIMDQSMTLSILQSNIINPSDSGEYVSQRDAAMYPEDDFLLLETRATYTDLSELQTSKDTATSCCPDNDSPEMHNETETDTPYNSIQILDTNKDCHDLELSPHTENAPNIKIQKSNTDRPKPVQKLNAKHLAHHTKLTKSDASGISTLLSNVKTKASQAFDKRRQSANKTHEYPGTSGICVLKSIDI